MVGFILFVAFVIGMINAPLVTLAIIGVVALLEAL